MAPAGGRAAAQDMKPLTKLEKVLLFLLAAIAIIAGMVVLVIQPATNRSDALDASIMERETTVGTITAELSSAAGVAESIGEVDAEIARERAYYLPVMTNNELDEYVTGLLQSHGLTPLSLTISEPEDAAQDIVKTYYVDTAASGSMTQFMLLIDTVRELTGIRISAIQAVAAPATPAPTPTPTPRARNKKTTTTAQTPAPAFAAAGAQQEQIFTIQTTFVVQEYDESAAVVTPAPTQLPFELSSPAPETAQ